MIMSMRIGGEIVAGGKFKKGTNVEACSRESTLSCSFSLVGQKVNELAGFVSRECISNVGSQGTDYIPARRSVSGAVQRVAAELALLMLLCGKASFAATD